MSTINGGTITVSRGYTNVQASGNVTLQLLYSNPGGTVVHSRLLTIFADGSKIVDQFGNVVANSVPSALANAITSFTAQLDTSIANAAAAGKLNF